MLRMYLLRTLSKYSSKVEANALDKVWTRKAPSMTIPSTQEGRSGCLIVNEMKHRNKSLLLECRIFPNSEIAQGNIAFSCLKKSVRSPDLSWRVMNNLPNRATSCLSVLICSVFFRLLLLRCQ
eukprot:Lithocolla_globosa_v1_NODE_10544_length_589_cov_1.958801.p1 type:complete len:123 gc:universal NODE_10544_length_589_cov_1.958801:440-72(-)